MDPWEMLILQVVGSAEIAALIADLEIVAEGTEVIRDICRRGP